MPNYSGLSRNGPRVGNRNRNTLRNNASHGAGIGGNGYSTPVGGGRAPMPPLTPSQEGGYAAQVAALQQQLAGAMALQRAGITAARGTYQSAAAEARQLRISETAGAVNNALDRGIFNSSVDLAGRTQAITDAAAQQQQARIARDQAIAQLRAQGITAQGDYYSGLAGVQTDRANAEAEAAYQAYQNDLFDTQQQNFDAMRRDILQSLRSNGRRRDGVTGAGGGGGAGGWTGGIGYEGPVGSLNQRNRQQLLSDYYNRGNPAGRGIGLPYPGRPGVRF